MMLEVFLYILEIKKEFLICFSFLILYLTYYLVEVVKRPTLHCRAGSFRRLLEARVPLLRQRYWPTPWCVEAHLQTVLGSVLRSQLLAPVHYRREVLRLSDGGQVALDWAELDDRRDRPVLLVLPGLTGGAQADYVRCLVAAARELGAHTVVFNNRGLGGLPLTIPRPVSQTPRLYSAVSHEDLGEALESVRARAGGPLLAAGVSLGALILGQYLAARGARAAGVLRAALAVSAPLDAAAGAAGAGALLSWHMARSLRRTVRAHAALRRAWPALERCRSLRQFDAAFTARHFGFASADAYYAAATLRGRLRGVRVPLLCLQAADDPLQPARVLPAAEAAASARVALLVTARGGHIGFLEGWWPAPPATPPHLTYVARLATQYFAALLAEPLPPPAEPLPAA